MNEVEKEALERLKELNEVGNLGITEKQLEGLVKFFSAISSEHEEIGVTN